MKNYFYSALAMIVLAGCAGSEIDEVVDNGQPVEIKLNGGISGVVTKAAIKQGEAVTGVQFAKIDGDNPVWTGISAIGLTGEIAEATGAITFSAPQYYPGDGSPTNIVAFYPAAKTFAAGVASMEITGAEDVLYAGVQSGSKTVKMPNLGFAHKLTQFKFVVKRENTVSVDVADVSIKVKDANTTFKLALADGALSGWGTPISTIQPMTNGTATLAGSNSTPGIMLEPDMSSIKLLVSGTGYAEREVTIQGTDNSKFEVGKAYTITLTFKPTLIESGATIADWTPGTDAGGDVQ